MAKISINTAQRVVPMIYAYTTPEIAKHNGWTKIGYTEQDVEQRLELQMWNINWNGRALRFMMMGQGMCSMIRIFTHIFPKAE